MGVGRRVRRFFAQAPLLPTSATTFTPFTASREQSDGQRIANAPTALARIVQAGIRESASRRPGPEMRRVGYGTLHPSRRV